MQKHLLYQTQLTSTFLMDNLSSEEESFKLLQHVQNNARKRVGLTEEEHLGEGSPLMMTCLHWTHYKYTRFFVVRVKQCVLIPKASKHARPYRYKSHDIFTKNDSPSSS